MNYTWRGICAFFNDALYWFPNPISLNERNYTQRWSRASPSAEGTHYPDAEYCSQLECISHRGYKASFHSIYGEPFGLTEPQDLWRSMSDQHTWLSSDSVCVILIIQHHALYFSAEYYYVHGFCVPNMFSVYIIICMSTSKSKQHEQCQRFIQGVYKESRYQLTR